MPQRHTFAVLLASLAFLGCGRTLELEPGEGGGGFGVTGTATGDSTSNAQGGASPGVGPTGAGGSSPAVTSGPAGPSGQGGFGVTVGPGPSGQGGADVGPGQGPGPGGQGGFGQGPGPGGQGGFGQGPGPGGQGGFGQGPGPSGQGGSSPSCDGFGDPCTNCISNECPSRWCDCLDNPECLALLQCSNSCGDDGCVADCQAEHASGVSDLYLVIDCADEQCGNACPGVGEVPDCSECLFESCESVTNTCFAEPDCLGLYDCLVSCDEIDLECNSECYETYPDGIDPLQDLLQCADSECEQDCN